MIRLMGFLQNQNLTQPEVTRWESTPHRSAAGTVTLQGTVYLHILVKYLSMENCLFIFCNAYVCANMLIGIYCSMRVT